MTVLAPECIPLSGASIGITSQANNNPLYLDQTSQTRESMPNPAHCDQRSCGPDMSRATRRPSAVSRQPPGLSVRRREVKRMLFPQHTIALHRLCFSRARCSVHAWLNGHTRPRTQSSSRVGQSGWIVAPPPIRTLIRSSRCALVEVCGTASRSTPVSVPPTHTPTHPPTRHDTNANACMARIRCQPSSPHALSERVVHSTHPHVPHMTLQLTKISRLLSSVVEYATRSIPATVTRW